MGPSLQISYQGNGLAEGFGVGSGFQAVVLVYVRKAVSCEANEAPIVTIVVEYLTPTA